MMKSVGDDSVCDSSLTAAKAVVIRAQPRDFILIKQEWAAIRIQALFRAFLVINSSRQLYYGNLVLSLLLSFMSYYFIVFWIVYYI